MCVRRKQPHTCFPSWKKLGIGSFPRQNLLSPCFSFGVSYRNPASRALTPSLCCTFLAPSAGPAGSRSSQPLKALIGDHDAKPSHHLPSCSTSPKPHGKVQASSLLPSPTPPPKKKPGMNKLSSRMLQAVTKPTGEGEMIHPDRRRSQEASPCQHKRLFLFQPCVSIWEEDEGKKCLPVTPCGLAPNFCGLSGAVK